MKSKAMSKSPARGAKSPRKQPMGAEKKRASSRSRSPAKTRDSKAATKNKSEVQDADELGLLTAPISTSYYFLLGLTEFLVWFVKATLQDKRFLFGGLPLLIAYVASRLHFVPELYAPPADCSASTSGALLWEYEILTFEAIWWIVLGILSSIGFGTGLHSGIMFLFPHLMSTVFAAESCGSLDGMPTLYLHPCKYHCAAGAQDRNPFTFFELFMRATGPFMLWGFGTAIGELPPYFISLSASRAGGKDADYEQELKDAETKKDPFNQLKNWTVKFTQKHGFVGVLLLASWPNAAFDMCGMCCGYVQMPFWTFFIATSLGKGVIKTNGQVVFFITLFGKVFFERILIDGLAKGLLQPVLDMLGVSFDAPAFLLLQRARLIRKFKLEGRVAPPAQGAPGWDAEALAALFAGAGLADDGTKSMVSNVFSALDTSPKDARLAHSELMQLVSPADGKLSYSSLVQVGDSVNQSDGGLLGGLNAGTILKTAWDGFLVSVIAYFFYAIINQMAESKAAELREKKMKKKN